MKISDRINSMQESPIRKLFSYAEEAKKKGKKVYHLNIGQPDIKTPDEYYEAIKNYGEKVLKYAPSEGMPELIDSFINYYKSFGIDYRREEILITTGGSEALIFALMAVCDCGDEILVPEPFYANYNSFCSLANVKIVPITTKAEEGFSLPAKEEITKLINKKTKAILFSNPSNPTGKVLTERETGMIKEIALEYDLYIISDEVYREFVYDGLQLFTFEKYEDIQDRLIVTDSISKRYSACGARIGCLISKNKEIMRNVLKMCQSRLCSPTLDQVGASKLNLVQKDYMKDIIEEYDRRRNTVYSHLNNIEGVICKKPKGAFYIIAKLPVDSAEKFAKWMLTDFDLNNETVMVAPAEGFYATKGLGKDEIRISYVLKIEDLEKAMTIIEKAIVKYNSL